MSSSILWKIIIYNNPQSKIIHINISRGSFSGFMPAALPTTGMSSRSKCMCMRFNNEQ
jgi:hypothetical protein